MSGNMALVVDQAGASLEIGNHDTLVLIHCDGRRERVGLRALGSVLLHGDVKLSSGVMLALAAEGVPLTLLPRSGRSSAAGFTAMPHRHLAMRHRQHLAFADPRQHLDLARRVVWAKLEAFSRFAREYAPDTENIYYRALGAASEAPDLAALMGVEGAASARHFETLAALYERSGLFRFPGRSRQPPRDPPNGLMSLSYRLAQSQAASLVLRAGMDLELGFLHAPLRDRESLALDLLEPARAALNGWVYELLVQHKRLAPSLFAEAENGAVRLTKEGRTAFYPQWYRDGHALALGPMRHLLAGLLSALRAWLPDPFEQGSPGDPLPENR